MAAERAVILCPGQGAQRVGMGGAWLERSEAFRSVMQRADELLRDAIDGSLIDACLRGPEERINRTDIAQPALFAVGVACFTALAQEGEISGVEAAAGLSLGEYTALHLAGAMTFEDALRVVAIRGAAMQRAALASDGGMVALTGADEEKALELCEAARGPGEVLAPANFNAPGQIVVSGSRAACERTVEVAATMGLRATPLAVAGAFHSPLMAPAAEELAQALEQTPIEPPSAPAMSNVTGEPHEADPAAIRQRLVEQVTAPVRWDRCCAYLCAHWDSATHELAPGRVLAGLMRRIDRSRRVTSHDEP